MSSFDIYDNYNSFNDLINRTELLEEKTYKAMVKGANLGPELKKFKTEDGKGLSATSRIKNLILISALVQMDLLDDDVAKTLRKKATSSTYITNTLKDLAPKVHDQLFDGDTPGSEAVVKYVQDNIEQLLPFAVKNVTRGEYEKTEVDTEVPDDAEAKELEDDVSAEVRLAKGLIDQEADKVELDFDDVDVNIEALDNKDEVAAKIAQLINTTNNLKAEPTGVGLNIEGPVGVFGSEEKVSDQMTRLITKYFPSVREAEIRVTLNTDNEEDYEEGPEPIEPEGPANEYEEGINEVEDEDNEFDDFDIGPQSDESIPDDYEEVLKAMVTKDKEELAKNMIEDEEEVAEEALAGLAAAAGRGLASAGRGIAKAATSAPAKELYKKAGKVAKKGLKVGAGTITGALGGAAEGAVDVAKGAVKGVGKTLKGAVEGGLEAAVSDEEIEVGSTVTTNYGEVVMIDEIDTDSDMKGRPVYMGRDKDGGEHVLYLDQIHAVTKEDEEDEESIVMQPMLESYKTDTSVYLIEQSASDKRNKKTEVKNQSFKERYKPKTHWQLEELRRYGL